MSKIDCRILPFSMFIYNLYWKKKSFFFGTKKEHTFFGFPYISIYTSKSLFFSTYFQFHGSPLLFTSNSEFRFRFYGNCFLNLGLSIALNRCQKSIVKFRYFLCLYIIYIEKKSFPENVFLCVCVRVFVCVCVCACVRVWVCCQFFVAR